MKPIRIMLLIVACCPALIAQHQSEVSPADTARTEGILLLDPGIALGKPTLLLPPWLEPGATLSTPSFLYGSMRPGLPSSLIGQGIEPKIDLTATLRLQGKRDEGLQLLYSVLGAVQAGGVAYLAYRHVKKYGFRR